MCGPECPALRELAVQDPSSVERGYDMLAPEFDPTSGHVLDAAAEALAPLGPFADGLGLCRGTGAGTRPLARPCRLSVTGVGFGAGMLDIARRRMPPGSPGCAAAPGPCRSPTPSVPRPASGTSGPACSRHPDLPHRQSRQYGRRLAPEGRPARDARREVRAARRRSDERRPRRLRLGNAGPRPPDGFRPCRGSPEGGAPLSRSFPVPHAPAVSRPSRTGPSGRPSSRRPPRVRRP